MCFIYIGLEKLILTVHGLEAHVSFLKSTGMSSILVLSLLVFVLNILLGFQPLELSVEATRGVIASFLFNSSTTTGYFSRTGISPLPCGQSNLYVFIG